MSHIGHIQIMEVILFPRSRFLFTSDNFSLSFSIDTGFSHSIVVFNIRSFCFFFYRGDFLKVSSDNEMGNQLKITISFEHMFHFVFISNKIDVIQLSIATPQLIRFSMRLCNTMEISSNAGCSQRNRFYFKFTFNLELTWSLCFRIDFHEFTQQQTSIAAESSMNESTQQIRSLTLYPDAN